MKYFKNVMLALVAFVFVACGSDDSEQVKVVREFINEYYNNEVPTNIEKIRYYLSSEANQGYRTEVLQKYAGQNKGGTKRKDGIKDIIVNKEEQINNTTRIDFTISFGNGNTINKKYSLIKENDRYVIDSLNYDSPN